MSVVLDRELTCLPVPADEVRAQLGGAGPDDGSAGLLVAECPS